MNDFKMEILILWITEKSQLILLNVRALILNHFSKMIIIYKYHY